MKLSLVRPTFTLEKEFLAIIKDFRINGEQDIEGLYTHCGENFHEYVLQTQLIEAGKTFANMIVPYSTYWSILDQERIIGFSHIRHYLTPALCIEGGHIGYSICPSERQKGYGKQQLQLILNECCKLGINEVLITCDFDNVASYKIIEANGGVKKGEAISPKSKKVVFHYQVHL
ncbi:MAG: GNAT family N-acetyltransferase [Anaerolineaceae bacterium]|nr:GNAT family N-acetyltransferase [Anaerolineaceae bacterium]